MHADAECVAIHQIFSVVQGPENPTPRQIKLYVNELGALHREWQHKYPLLHLAYFAGLRRRGDDVRTLLLTPDHYAQELKQVSAITGSTDLRRNLAGLAWGTTPELGMELLLAEPLGSALRNGQAEGMERLAEDFPDGFSPVLEYVLTADLPLWAPMQIAVAARTLEKLLASGRVHMDDGHALGRAALGVQDWSPLVSDTLQGLCAICHLLKSAPDCQEVLRNVQWTLDQLGASDEPRVALARDPSALADFVSTLIEGGVDFEAIHVPWTAQEWPGACLSLQARPIEVRRKLHPTWLGGDIVSAMVADVSAGRFTPDMALCLRLSLEAAVVANAAPLVEAIESRLNASRNAPPEETWLLITTLEWLSSLEGTDASAALGRLAAGGHVLHHLNQASAPRNPAYIAELIVLHLSKFPAADDTPPIGNSARGYKALQTVLTGRDQELAVAVIQNLEKRCEVDLLRRVADARRAIDPFLYECFHAVASKPYSARVFEPGFLARNWQTLREQLFHGEGAASEYNAFLERLVQTPDYVETFVSSTAFDVEAAALYRALRAAGTGEAFDEWVRDGLVRVGSVTWKEQLVSGKPCLALAAESMRGQGKDRIWVPLRDALVSYARDLLNSKGSPVPESSRVLALLAASSDDGGRRQLARDVLLELKHVGGHGSKGFFDAFGQLLADRRLLAEDPYLVRDLINPAVRDRVVPALNWLADALNSQPDVASTLEAREGFDDLRSRLSEQFAEGEQDEAQVCMERVRSALGLGPHRHSLSNTEDATSVKPS
jgi:hypothetical protein